MPFVEKIRWVKIAKNADEFIQRIPEQKIYKFGVGKQNLCLTRYGRKVYAFENKCPHQFMAMTNGACTEDHHVVCPWHRFAFSLETGKGAGLYLPVFPVKEEEGSLFIGFKQTVFRLFRK